MGDADYGPVLPLYLNLEECEVVYLAVELLQLVNKNIDGGRIEAFVKVTEGPAGIARLDRTMAATRDRGPILRSLLTALAELGYSLNRTDADGS